MIKVDNAIIMAAGISSRFVPISFEKPKSLIKVKGEVLIERQIRQLKEVGIHEIIVVVGYKKDDFTYLKKDYGVILVENPEYNTRNNHASLYYAKKYLKNTYICSSDNYFTINPFNQFENEAFYSSIYVSGDSKEWCLSLDENDMIKDVKIGGVNSWVMMGHVFFDETFSEAFIKILGDTYHSNETKNKLWEQVYVDHISKLKLKCKKFTYNRFFEFDSLDELRVFDNHYFTDSNSKILLSIRKQLSCSESALHSFEPTYKDFSFECDGFRFKLYDSIYYYSFASKSIEKEKKLEEREIETLLKEALTDTCIEIHNYKRLGGLTNRNYVIKSNKGSYFVRFAGYRTNEFINRHHEHIHTKLISDYNIDAKLIHFNPNTGLKINEYLDHAITLNKEIIQKNKDLLKGIAFKLSDLHKMETQSSVEFNVFELIDQYEKHILENSGELWNDYETSKKELDELKSKYQSLNIKKVLCHNDPLCENFMIKEDRIYLTDWEYAGLNDPLWDVADFIIESEIDKDDELYFIQQYLDLSVSVNVQLRIALNKVFIDFLWSLWAIMKYSLEKDDEMLNWGNQRYIRFKEYLNQYRTEFKNYKEEII